MTGVLPSLVTPGHRAPSGRGDSTRAEDIEAASPSADMARTCEAGGPGSPAADRDQELLQEEALGMAGSLQGQVRLVYHLQGTKQLRL